MKVIASLGLLILMTSVIFANQAFAESLDNIKIFVSNYDGDSATVRITWNHDDKVTNYKIGCVSCNPNTVKFISENGGQVFESDLRKKFLQPRTTMWRAVKRLERLGIVEIYKKDLQNMVKLRNDLEEEN